MRTTFILFFLHLSIFAQDDTLTRIEQLCYGPLNNFSSIEEVFHLFGKPKILNSEPHKNPYYPETTDSIITFKYDSLLARYHWVSTKKMGYMVELFIEGSKYSIPLGIKLGMTKSEIIDLIGKPNNEKDEYIEYNDDSYSFVRLHFKEKQLINIKWTSTAD